MLNSRRIFVDAVKKYCARHSIAIELRSEGWLIVMHRGPRRHFAFGYDIGLNSAVAHRIANDKALPFEPLIPNADTIEAMKAVRRGDVVDAGSVDALFASLNAED